MRTRGSNKSPAATRPASDAKKLTESKSAAPPRRLPVFLWAPNLIGYIRVLTLIEGMRAEDPASNYALWCITTSYLLDYLDGPCARKLNQCSQFGDLLDHFTDHATNMYLVWVTSPHNTLYGRTNIGVSAIHNGVIFLYMIAKGHYMKHGSGNVVTRAIEQNNYWNVWSLLWGFNTYLIPLIRMSYAHDHKLSLTASTQLLDLADMLGMVVTITYTIAMWL